MVGGALAALASLTISAAAAATLVVKVEKVSPRGGDIRVGLYNAQNYAVANADPVTDAVVPAKPGETVVTLSNLRPGIYAVKMFQDFNRNGRFDMNWLGLPEEKYGFSNDARPALTEPPFDATKFELKPSVTTIIVHLQ